MANDFQGSSEGLNRNGNHQRSPGRMSRQSIRGTGGAFVEAVRARPVVSAAIAAGAAGIGAFLWAKRAPIGEQFSDLTWAVAERFGSEDSSASGRFSSEQISQFGESYLGTAGGPPGAGTID